MVLQDHVRVEQRKKLKTPRGFLAIGVLPEKVAEALKMPLDEVMKLMKK